MSDNEKARSKLKRSNEKGEGTDRDGERSGKKRHKHARNEESSSHRSKRHRDKSRERDKASSSKSKSKSRVKIIDDDPDEGMWVEKNIDMDGENVRLTFLLDFFLNMLKRPMNISAYCTRYTYRRVSKDHFPRKHLARRRTPSTKFAIRVQARSR